MIKSQINIKNEFGAIMGLVGCVYVIFMANCYNKYFVTTISRLLGEFNLFYLCKGLVKVCVIPLVLFILTYKFFVDKKTFREIVITLNRW